MNNKPCLLCSGDVEQCDAADGEPNIDLLVTGSPCNPFSQQCAKRFVTGQVKNHELFSVTMSSVLAMYSRFEPPLGLLEQVVGFQLPFEKGGKTTPKQRPEIFSKGCQDYGPVTSTKY